MVFYFGWQNRYYNYSCIELDNESTKLWLKDNDIKNYSTHIERKSTVAEKNG